MRQGAYLLAVAMGAAIAACDPCTGVAGCNVAPHAGVTGQLLDDASGAPVNGAVIDLVRTGGVALERDSSRTTTDAAGLFSFDLPASDEGEVIATIVVRPPGSAGYRANEVRIPASRRGGEARVLPAWSTTPHLPDFAQIFRRGGGREAVPFTDIEFRRTGGVAFRDLPGEVFRAQTNATGLVELFGDKVQPVDAGDVVGDLTVFLSDPPGPSTNPGFRITATPVFRPSAQIRAVGAGPNLNYQFLVTYRGAPGLNVAGAQVSFQRTGGMEIDPPAWTLTTDHGGAVYVPSRAPRAGTVTGDVTIVPPAPWKSYTRTGMELTTYFDDRSPIARTFGVGPGLPYYVIIRAAGAPLKGAEVTFTRTAGLDVIPSPFTGTTNDEGSVNLVLDPRTEGEVTGDVTVKPPAPYSSFTVRGVRMQAIDDDVPGGRTLLGDWDVTAPPALRR